jgi:hypothetical protein
MLKVTNNMKNPKKVTVNLPEEDIKFLQRIAENDEVSFTDVLRSAISTHRFFKKAMNKGEQILLSKDGGNTFRIVTWK